MSDSVPNTTGQWRIQLFGALEIEKPTGEKISLSCNKAGELLAYLALSPRQTHPREKLISLLWGDSEVSNVRTRLRQEVFTLRSLFPSETGQPPLLLVAADTLQLQPAAQVDAVRFLEACAEAKREENWEQKKRLYAEARSLYRADLLGKYDALWIVSERVRFSRRYEQVLLECAEAYRQRQDYAGAEETLQSLFAHNPVLEEGYILLMRLYAEQGQPTRVQQQYHTLELALRDAGEVSPTEATRQLAESLRAVAGQRASALIGLSKAVPTSSENLATVPAIFEPNCAEMTFSSAATETILPAIAPSIHNVAGRRFAGLLGVCLMILAVALGLRYREAPRWTPSPASVASVPLLRNQEKWTFYYQPRPGERPNAEGRSLATDATGIYVTGLIQTDKEDTDILTLKPSPEGNLLWADRYSSPEHDCDRAFSLCLDGKGSVYVAGETYVPSGAKDAEGWHLTVLSYDTNGQRLWVKRSPFPTKNEENVQVSPDSQGGCYVGGTALKEGKQSALLMRYERSGRLLWQKTFREGAGTTFSRLAVNAAGRLFFCGTAQRVSGQSAVNEDWMIACLNPNGDVAWMQLEDRPAHGNDTAGRIHLDRGGNVLVAGVFDTGDTAQSGQGLKLAVEKFNAEGRRLWQRTVQESGPAVVLEALSSNHQGNVAIGGTEQHPDGTWSIFLNRYDSFGNHLQTWRYTPPPGYRSAALHSCDLLDNELIRFVGLVTSGVGSDMHTESSMLFATSLPDNRLLDQRIFDTGPGQKTSVYDSARAYNGKLVVTGQAGMAANQHALCVLLCY